MLGIYGGERVGTRDEEDEREDGVRSAQVCLFGAGDYGLK